MPTQQSNIKNVVIIGGGPAGLTAALYAARANLMPVVIEGTVPGGQLMSTSYVENWPGEKRILGPALMANIKEQVNRFAVEFVADSVTTVDFTKPPFTLTTTRGTTFRSHSVIIATGASAKRLGCPGESDYWGKGVTVCAVCDGAFYPDKHVVIVGGGDTAMEDASFLKKFTKRVTIIQILDTLTACYPLQQQVLKDPDITVIYTSTVTEVHGSDGHVTGITILNTRTNTTHTLACDAVFIAIGLNPNTALFKGQLAFQQNGYLQVENSTHSSVPGVFIAGDVADYRYRQAITASASGCMAALDAERYLKTVLVS